MSTSVCRIKKPFSSVQKGFFCWYEPVMTAGELSCQFESADQRLQFAGHAGELPADVEHVPVDELLAGIEHLQAAGGAAVADPGGRAVHLVELVPVLNLVVPAGNVFHLSDYSVSLLGKIMCYAICALAMDLIWGYTGILSLGHGLFFALGGYAMGMYLMRQIGREGNYQSDLPDFMVFLDWKAYPWYWSFTDHFWYAALLVVLVAVSVRGAIGVPQAPSMVQAVTGVAWRWSRWSRSAASFRAGSSARCCSPACGCTATAR